MLRLSGMIAPAKQGQCYVRNRKNLTTSKIMKKETIKYIIQLIVAILTAIGSTLSVTTAASGDPAEGVALLGGTIVGTGWLHHISTLV